MRWGGVAWRGPRTKDGHERAAASLALGKGTGRDGARAHRLEGAFYDEERDFFFAVRTSATDFDSRPDASVESFYVRRRDSKGIRSPRELKYAWLDDK